MHRFDHWIFDLDGTLTVPQHDFDAIRAELGVPPGCLILEYLEGIASAKAAPIRARLHDLETKLANAAEAADGARELIEILSARGVDVGILTRNTRQNALDALRCIGLAKFFPGHVVLGREDHAPKPAPDGIEHLLAGWRGRHTHCVMVGDFRFDLEAGRNAGVTTVHVAPSDAECWPELTDHRFESLRELANRFS
jgi:HAD superfamily hydrolase (TIGR01509 family)